MASSSSPSSSSAERRRKSPHLRKSIRTAKSRGDQRALQLWRKVEAAQGKLPFHLYSERVREQLYPSFLKVPREVYSEVLHQEVAEGLWHLVERGLFQKHVVHLKHGLVTTLVGRMLVGLCGLTYPYLNLRLFPLAWNTPSEALRQLSADAVPAEDSSVDGLAGLTLEASEALLRKSGLLEDLPEEVEDQKLRSAVSALSELNRALEDQARVSLRKIGQQSDSAFQRGTQFNFTLINFFDPAHEARELPIEPFYGMGPMAVGWHKDSGVTKDSTIAVYNCTSDNPHASLEAEQEDGGDREEVDLWKIALKISWDAETPGLLCPLRDGDSYFMLGDCNEKHQHAVVAGSIHRFSSTHRIAPLEGNSVFHLLVQLDRIPTAEPPKSLYSAVLDEAREPRRKAPRRSGEEGRPIRPRPEPVDDFERTLELVRVAEFDWIRMFWVQGRRHSDDRGWWRKAIACVEEHWQRLWVRILLYCGWALRYSRKLPTSSSSSLSPSSSSSPSPSSPSLSPPSSPSASSPPGWLVSVSRCKIAQAWRVLEENAPLPSTPEQFFFRWLSRFSELLAGIGESRRAWQERLASHHYAALQPLDQPVEGYPDFRLSASWSELLGITDIPEDLDPVLSWMDGVLKDAER